MSELLRRSSCSGQSHRWLIRLFNTQKTSLREALLHNRQNYGLMAQKFSQTERTTTTKKKSAFEHGFSFHLTAFFVKKKSCYPLLLNLLATESNYLFQLMQGFATLATLKSVEFNSYPMNDRELILPWGQIGSKPIHSQPLWLAILRIKATIPGGHQLSSLAACRFISKRLNAFYLFCYIINIYVCNDTSDKKSFISPIWDLPQMLAFCGFPCKSVSRNYT